MLNCKQHRGIAHNPYHIPKACITLDMYKEFNKRLVIESYNSLSTTCASKYSQGFIV